MVTRMLLATALVVAAGCGGSQSGGGGGGGGNNDPLQFTIPDTTIAYGDRVTISWTSDNVQRMDTDRTSGTNFVVEQGDTSGSIVDRPAVDTIYRIKGVTFDEGYATATLTVKVRPSTKSFLVIAGKGDPLALQVISELRSVTTGPLYRGEQVPSTPIADVIVILDSASFSQAEEPRVRSLLSAGGRLLLLKHTVLKLAGAGGSNHDISVLSSWFGGATAGFVDHGGYPVVNNLDNVPCSLVQVGLTSGGGESGIVVVHPVAQDAELMMVDDSGRVAAFGFRPSIGGRIVHLGALSFGPSTSHQVMRSVFLGACRWLADYPDF